MPHSSDESGLFAPLPAHPASPSDLDENPRYLRLAAFASRFLPDPRDILVYLPEAYFTDPSRRFPVFYLHDGQNLFDGRTSYLPNRTWRAHTTADALTARGEIEPLILVGIANTGLRRMPEYTPTRDPKLGGGEGPLYSRLLIQELKPLIDHTFRTLSDAAHTAIGGSSLGGLISLAIALDCPQIFGKAAVLSPSLWWDNRSILNRLTSQNPHLPLKLWLDIGTAEGLRHVRDTDQLHHQLLQRGWRDSQSNRDSQSSTDSIDLHYLRIPNGLHDEDAWAARFDKVLRFLFPA